MTLTRLIASPLVLMAVLSSLVLDFGPLSCRVLAQRSDDDESRDRGGEDGRERRRRFFGGGEGGEFRGRRFGGEGGEFRGRGFGGGEGAEGGGFRGRGFGGRDGGGRPELSRNRSEAGESRDEDGDRERRREERRDERREERGNESSAMDPADYARSLVKERDKNGNGMLEGDELSELRGPAASADADKNNVVTVDEIVARMSNREGSRNSQGDKPSAGSSADKDKAAGGAAPGMASRVFMALAAPGAAGDKSAANAKRTYRFTPPSERPGLPGWIKSRDRNKNGQVEMSEYSRSWSQRTVGEFRRYDLNDDGVVTVKEATASEAK